MSLYAPPGPCTLTRSDLEFDFETQHGFLPGGDGSGQRFQGKGERGRVPLSQANGNAVRPASSSPRAAVESPGETEGRGEQRELLS